MPRWAWFLPLAGLGLVGALYAFRLGWIAANLAEGDVILAYAERYLRLAGPDARAEQCRGVPGQGPGVWITVVCAPQDGPAWRFDVNRFGGLVRTVPPGKGAPDGTAPQT